MRAPHHPHHQGCGSRLGHRVSVSANLKLAGASCSQLGSGCFSNRRKQRSGSDTITPDLRSSRTPARIGDSSRSKKTMKAPSAGHPSGGLLCQIPSRWRELVFGVGGEHRGLKLQCRYSHTTTKAIDAFVAEIRLSSCAATSAQSISSNPVAVTGARPLLPIAAPDRDRPASRTGAPGSGVTGVKAPSATHVLRPSP